ncbi:hypothetical protein FGO68_gene11307 [Halteria grandinella]|uniref:CCT domain-containing protein n=1 Tax=Halteria grandinella TaxID=5974 RepID=A0A8J8T1A8_HALGN|nr:hypothetical protein FGO68_gene11307 [Halteria grandinella]
MCNTYSGLIDYLNSKSLKPNNYIILILLETNFVGKSLMTSVQTVQPTAYFTQKQQQQPSQVNQVPLSTFTNSSCVAPSATMVQEVNRANEAYDGVFKRPLPIKPFHVRKAGFAPFQPKVNTPLVSEMMIAQKTQIAMQQMQLQIMQQQLALYQRQLLINQENEIRERNKSNLKYRLYQIASVQGNLDRYIIREPGEDTDYTQWGERIYTVSEIDQIIKQSGLVQRKHAGFLPQGSSLLFQAAKYINQTTETNFAPDEEENDQENLSTEEDSNETYIGQLTIADRRLRVLEFKKKIYARRISKPISKKFNGRSKVACQKLRINGKFVKKSQLVDLSASPLYGSTDETCSTKSE